MNNYSQMDITSYLAKYIDENQISSEKDEDEMY